jgi:hypothetical protein
MRRTPLHNQTQQYILLWKDVVHTHQSNQFHIWSLQSSFGKPPVLKQKATFVSQTNVRNSVCLYQARPIGNFAQRLHIFVEHVHSWNLFAWFAIYHNTSQSTTTDDQSSSSTSTKHRSSTYVSCLKLLLMIIAKETIKQVSVVERHTPNIITHQRVGVWTHMLGKWSDAYSRKCVPKLGKFLLYGEREKPPSAHITTRDDLSEPFGVVKHRW